jgi:hypothetical protein
MTRSARSATHPRKRQRRRGDRWTYSYGVKPYIVFAFERPERANQVWIRWTNLSKPDLRRPGEHKREVQTLGVIVRDQEGRLDPRLVRSAEVAVQQFQARLVTGTAPPAPPIAAAEEPASARPKPDTLTLREGFALALDPDRGKYATTDTRHYDQIVKYEERLFGGRPGRRPLISPDLPWRALELRDIRVLWRAMADAYVRTEGKEFGVRAAEMMIDSLFSVAAWLREESRIPSDAARPPENWRRRLKEEWELRTGERQTRPYRPRHTEEEFRRIFVALDDARVDPRIRLAIELAAECRTGQVLRCTRRMLTVSDVASTDYENVPAGSLGQVVIPGAGKKHGEIVVLTPEQRRAVDDALGGYLAKYEAAWLTKEIEDYFLFPGSRMRMLDESGRRGVRRVRAGAKPLSRDGARQLFKDLEAIAEVDHIRGRGWYGLRRQAADMAETATTDDRVKDRLGGWQDSETRKSIYQDRETDALRAQAASVRRQLRLGRGLVVGDGRLVNSAVIPTNDHVVGDDFEVDEIATHWDSLTTEERRALLLRLAPQRRSE